MSWLQIIKLSVLFLSYFMRSFVLCEPGAGPTNWIPNEDSWHYWWSYSGISGPAYWGLLNLDWSICDRGRQQSPINIETKGLVYDPHLTSLKIDNHLISGLLYNDGHAIVFNGSMPLFFLENMKAKSDDTAKGKQSNSSVSKRSIDNDSGIFNKLNSLSLDSTSDKKDTASASIDLSNSVELSMKQSEANPTSSSIDSETENEPDATNYRNQIDDTASRIHFTGAGLSYPYKFEAFYLRFGSNSTSGSEHRIDLHAYAAELQLMAYNSLLYRSYAEASTKPHGLLGISVLIDILPTNETGSARATRSRVSSNSVLDSILARSSELQHRGSSAVVKDLNLSALLPDTDSFVSYEGSLTTPGCQESVDWLVLNKPLYITRTNVDILRSISADEQSNTPTGTLLVDNIRPVQPTNQRLIRTNIRPMGENPETCRRLWTKYDFKLTTGETVDSSTDKTS